MSSSNGEGKQSAKRRKILFFERIAFICTSCVTSSPRTHEVELDEGAAAVTQQKPAAKEAESAKKQQVVTREPSSATTRE